MQAANQGIPPAETRAGQTADSPSIAEVQWQSPRWQLPHTQATSQQLVAGLPPDSFAAVQIAQPANSQQLEPHLRLVHQLHQKNIVTSVIFEPVKHNAESRPETVANPELSPRLKLAFRAAGAVAVVTSICECDRLASVILKTAMTNRHVFASWRDRFVNRLPWQPVNDS